MLVNEQAYRRKEKLVESVNRQEQVVDGGHGGVDCETYEKLHLL